MAAARAALDAAGVPVAAAVLAAVSGGPDSTALLAALAELRAEGRLSLAACIVDHGIRDPGQVEGDIAFVQGLCISLEVPLHIARLQPGECRTRTRASIQYGSFTFGIVDHGKRLSSFGPGTLKLLP